MTACNNWSSDSQFSSKQPLEIWYLLDREAKGYMDGSLMQYWTDFVGCKLRIWYCLLGLAATSVTWKPGLVYLQCPNLGKIFRAWFGDCRYSSGHILTLGIMGKDNSANTLLCFSVCNHRELVDKSGPGLPSSIETVTTGQQAAIGKSGPWRHLVLK